MVEQFKMKTLQVEDVEEKIRLLQKKHQEELDEVVGRQKVELAKVKMSLGEYKEWSEKLKAIVDLELEELAKKNVDLQVTVEVQKLRLQPLQIMEQQMLAQEELSLSAVLMNEGEVAILKQQLALAAQGSCGRKQKKGLVLSLSILMKC